MVAVVRVGEAGMELVSQNEMGERIAASPVPVSNKLLVRGVDHLYCLGSK
jgi:hypothetical protein